MALSKKIQYANGTETNYHKISEMRITPITRYETVYPEVVEEETTITETVEVEGVEEVTETAEAEAETTETEDEGTEVEEAETGEPVEPIITAKKTYYTTIYVHSYVNQDIREGSERNFLQSKKYEKEVSEETIATPIMTLGYDILKSFPEFVDAEDV